MTLIDKAEALAAVKALHRLPISGLYGAAGVDHYGSLEDVAAAAIAAIPARGVGVDTEDVARAIYDAMRFERKDNTPEWVRGGNSNAQVEARATAARILAAQPGADVAAQAREAALREAAAVCDQYPYVEGVKAAILRALEEEGR